MEVKKHIIEINSLSKSYGDFLAIDNLSVDFPFGKIIGLLGPNGSGKTTLIKLFTGMLHQYEGNILIDGLKPGIDTKKVVSYLPDRNFLPRKWTAKDIIEYYKDFFPDFMEERAWELIKQLEIDPNKRFKEMSKGTKEKIQLIMILSRKAKLYIFDEPIAGVDPAARELIFRLILSNFDRECSIIICTHLISEVEDILDYAIFISKGKIALKNDVDAIREATGKSLNEVFKEMYRYA